MGVLVVGNIVLDIVNVVDHYPEEDEEMRTVKQFRRIGGNAANTSTTISILGAPCTILCTLPIGQESYNILTTLQSSQIDTSSIVHSTQTTYMPTSYILLNQKNGSRTIVHNRPPLPELNYTDFQTCTKVNDNTITWMHFEGRNIENVSQFIGYVRDLQVNRKDLCYSVELEKARSGIEGIAEHANVVFVSRSYIETRGGRTAVEGYSLVKTLVSRYTLVIVTWGELGAWGFITVDGASDVTVHVPASLPSGGKVTDTIGAGDCFIAATISYLYFKNNMCVWDEKRVREVLTFACMVAGEKCGQIYGESVDDLLSGYRRMLLEDTN